MGDNGASSSKVPACRVCVSKKAAVVVAAAWRLQTPKESVGKAAALGRASW